MLTLPDLAARLVLAAVLASLVGMERERLNWAAGMRTHMLVGLGAALFAIVSAYGFHDVLASGRVVLDPSRIAAQVVSGIGFLGAGTILFRREIIRGLTTAASLWGVAAVGLAVGAGLYLAALFTTALMLVILAVLKPIEKKFFSGGKPSLLTIVTQPRQVSLPQLEEALRLSGLQINQISIRLTELDDGTQFQLHFKDIPDPQFSSLLERLRGIQGVRDISHETDSVPP